MAGFYPKKALGQVFLMNHKSREKIFALLAHEPLRPVVEIGPGRGELTRFLIERFPKVYAVEIDPLLCHILKKEFKNTSLEVFCVDFLRWNPPDFAQTPLLVTNLPYHLSFEFINWIIRNRTVFPKIYAGFQKEFAQKITAPVSDKAYSLLTIKMALYGQTKLLFTIPREHFRPEPGIDSAFVEIAFTPGLQAPVTDEGLFFAFLRALFSQRRKKIKNILHSIYPQENVQEILNISEISGDLRPENLSLSDFTKIHSLLKNHPEKDHTKKNL